MDHAAYPERIFVDGIHPSVEGSAVLGAMVSDFLRAN